ncbi:MAG TPA: amino acid adenylation domain-containing protein, partial [Candidatus Deferrimicrobium sp.]|nr:amino acid adenylation domain-containing protein [Candidatus Deferrimicrobium sp.]
NRVTLAPVFYAAWGILLQKYSGSEDVVFGTVVSGRPALVKGIEDMVGLFINTIPLRIQSALGVKMIDIVSGVENVLQVREEFESTPLPDIGSYSTVGGSEALFDTIVAIENYPLDSRLLTGDSLFSVNSYSITEMTHYDLTVGIMPFNKIEIKFSYKKQLFEKETIENLARHFKRIIRDIMENPEIVLSQLEIISGEEKNRILYDFNNTAVEYPAGKTIPQLFAEQVGKSPDRIAVTGSTVETLRAASLQITYRQLNERAGRLAHLLIAQGVLANNIVAVMMERSIEMIIGIFGILKAGGAYLPIDPGYPRERIAYMLKDSGAQIIVGDGHSCSAELDCQLLNVNRQLFMSAPPAHFHHSSFIIPHPGNIAYIIYTSGSTGKPKGTLIKIEGFINLLRWYTHALNIGDTDNILLIAPISFDLAQKNLFSSFIVGGCLTLASPGIPDYHELSQVIQDRQITLINCAPSVFYPLIEANGDTGFTKLKFLRKIILGGEPIQVDKLQPWVNSGAYNCEIVNTYGPTECTDIASCYRIPNDTIRAQMMIPIGKPIYNVKIFILDKYLNILPVMVGGEICIGESGVSLGYCNNPGLTLEKFKEFPLFPGKRIGRTICQTIYRSGDIGRWLTDGNIEFLGRIDHQVKIRGFRIELGEIERQLLGNKDIKDAIVVANEIADETGKGNNYLCAYIITHKNLTTLELREYLAQRLPGYMIPTYFVRLEQIPLTPSGKVDRMSLPGPGIEAVCSYAAPRNKIEEKLVEIWTGILGRDIGRNISPYRIGIDENFFQLGGHSLKATSLASRIYKEFNVKIPLAEIFKRPTIRGLFDYINNYISSAVGEKYVSIEPVEEKEYYILSSAQKRLYFLQQKDTGGTAYNISAAWVLEGIIDKAGLEKAFAKLTRAHESLRTSFIMVDGEPWQRIHQHVTFKIESVESPAQTNEAIVKSFIRPFDLSTAPLWRVGLLELAKDRHLFLVDMHHIISDGISTGILVREFTAFYQGEKLPAMNLRYKDYVEWQNLLKQGENYLRQKEYWRKEFEGELTALELPTDYVRPVVQNFEGNRINFSISGETVAALNSLALKNGMTLYMVLLALYNIFLAKVSGQESIVIGTPVGGRRYTDLENVMGVFINTLALRHYPAGEKNFSDFLAEVKVKTLAAFENQDYQYEDLVEQVAVNRNTSRNPLFDTMFVLQNMDIGEIDIPGLKSATYDLENKTSKFDLTLTAMEIEEGLEFAFEFCTKLFKQSTIERFISFFKNIFPGVLENKYNRLSDLEIISGEEKKRVLYEFNHTSTAFPKNMTVDELFVEQVEKSPGRIAVGWAEGHLAYRELNERSRKLAGLLREKG